jgi:hypothetical protein
VHDGNDEGDECEEKRYQSSGPPSCGSYRNAGSGKVRDLRIEILPIGDAHFARLTLVLNAAFRMSISGDIAAWLLEFCFLLLLEGSACLFFGSQPVVTSGTILTAALDV